MPADPVLVEALKETDGMIAGKIHECIDLFAEQDMPRTCCEWCLDRIVELAKRRAWTHLHAITEKLKEPD